MKPCLFARFLNLLTCAVNLIPEKFRKRAWRHGLTRTDNRRLSLTIIIHCKYKRKIDICQVLAGGPEVRRMGKNQNKNQGSSFLFSTISAPPVFSARFQHDFSTVSAQIENGELPKRTKRAQNAHSNRTNATRGFFRNLAFVITNLTIHE